MGLTAAAVATVPPLAGAVGDVGLPVRRLPLTRAL